MENIQQQIQWLLQEKYNGVETEAAREDIEKLKAGEPVDYLIGFMDFLGCKIDLSKKPLIPRVETEFWVEKAIEDLEEQESLQVLDMFSGSGAIGIAIAAARRSLGEGGCDITFADSEENCIEQIEINAKLNKLEENRYTILQSDVFSNIQGKFDVIFANPPYIPVENKEKIQESVIKYEPKAALFGGEGGMQYITTFLSQAKNFLTERGRIYMEYDPHQKLLIEKIIKGVGYSQYEFCKDQYDKDRYVVIFY